MAFIYITFLFDAPSPPDYVAVSATRSVTDRGQLQMIVAKDNRATREVGDDSREC